MIYINALNESDKVTSLATLLDEIKAANIFDKPDRKSKVESLKSTCFYIDNFILNSIEYYKREYLEEGRIQLLIEHGKRLKELQKSFETELIRLGSKRDLQNEYELKTAFDFNLDDGKKKPFLSNSVEIELRIKEEIGLNIRQVKKSIFKKEIDKKVGRKKTEVKEVTYYLQKFISEEHKLRFIQELKKQYQNSEPSIFNYIVRILVDMGRVQITNNITIKTSFEKALGRKEQSSQNFNKQFSKDVKNLKEYKSIKNNIEHIIELSLTV